jgi:hypothetical protein
MIVVVVVEVVVVVVVVVVEVVVLWSWCGICAYYVVCSSFATKTKYF